MHFKSLWSASEPEANC